MKYWRNILVMIAATLSLASCDRQLEISSTPSNSNSPQNDSWVYHSES